MMKNWGWVHIVRFGNYLMTYEDATPNCFDSKVLLDPFEEEFDLPATPK